MRRLTTLVFLLAPAVAGCAEGPGGDRPVVVTTTTHVTDLTRHVAGRRVEVRPILGPDADPHGYEPRPSDARVIAGALLVVKSGGEVDGWLDELIDSAGGEAEVVSLIDSVETIEGEDGTDPHWWQDPRNAERAVAAIRDRLADADPGGRNAYRRNAEAYLRRLKRLDREIERCVERVSPGERRIVTTHDALGYFARRYGVRVVGSVIPSLSTHAQPSARDVERLVEQIRSEGVEAVFPEAAVPQRLEEAISREAGVTVGAPLHVDALGPEGSASATYTGAMRENARALVEGMSGGSLSCGR